MAEEVIENGVMEKALGYMRQKRVKAIRSCKYCHGQILKDSFLDTDFCFMFSLPAMCYKSG